MTDGEQPAQVLKTDFAPSASTPEMGQALASRAVSAIQSEAAARGWTIAVAIVDARGEPVAMVQSPRHGM